MRGWSCGAVESQILTTPFPPVKTSRKGLLSVREHTTSPCVKVLSTLRSEG